MGKIVAYLRVSTDQQDLNHQKLEILEFARRQGLRVDEYVEIAISSGKTSQQRRIDELVQRLDETDTLIVTELSRLGRSTAEVIALVNALLQRHIRVITLKQNLDIDRQDAVIGISFPRYSSKAATTLHYARSKGARVIALTILRRR